MDVEKLINLTHKLYDLTILFPKKEPLRYKEREVADEILRHITSWDTIQNSNPIKFLDVDKNQKEKVIIETEKNLRILKSYFAVSKRQNWVSFFDISRIEDEYDEIERDFKKEIENEAEEKLPLPLKKEKTTSFVFSSDKSEEAKDNLNNRQRKILDFLKEKEKAQVWQIKEIFPQTSKRTLRRDFEQLLKNNIIERMGERNNTFYRLRGK